MPGEPGTDFPANFFGGTNPKTRYSNPFYNVPFQFLPYDINLMLWWANHFLFRFPFYKTVLGRVSNYFITELNIECDDSEAKKKYEEHFEKKQWKQKLSETGLNLLAYGNSFSSITQGFDRFLTCTSCKRITNIDKIKDFEFSTECKYTVACRACGVKCAHEVNDRVSTDLSRLEILHWNPREVEVRHDKASNQSEYYWNIPQEYIARVTQVNNKFYSKKTPKTIYDAILKKKMVYFNTSNFIHLKMPTPVGIPTDGKAVPMCIYMFDDFFMLKVLERYNQALMYEDIIPFRVFSMAQQGAGNSQVNPVLHQSAPQWSAGIKRMIQEHRLDPATYHLFPFQFQYDHLGGEGKNLAPTELIQNTIGNILNALNIPQELYTMSLQVQAMGPALRLFENSWSFIIDIYNQMLDKWGEVIRKVNGLPKAKITLIPVTLADDIERKSIIGQLVQANAIARSELLKLYDFDYEDQVRKKMKEDEIQQDLQEEQQAKQQISEMSDSGGSSGTAGGTTPQDVLEQARELAQQIYPTDPASKRAKLQELKAQNATLYAVTKQCLDEMTSGAKSQGVQQSKQQGQ